MSIYLILFILSLHFIGDFMLQTDSMAKNKSKSNLALSKHVSFYILPFLALAPFLENWYHYLIVNAILHWMVDYVTSRINSKLYSEGKIHEFFCVVGFDQLLHYTCLLLTWRLLS